MVHYLVLTRYVVTQSLHGCLDCAVVPLCKLFDDRHHKHASCKKTKKPKRGNTVIGEMLWSALQHRSISGTFGHFISWDAPWQIGVQGEKNSSEFLSSFRSCKLLDRGCWFQRSTQNSLAFTALYDAPGKMTPFFQGWKLRSQGGSHCYNCLLGHLLSHFIS